jgi:hypothetical protein
VSPLAAARPLADLWYGSTVDFDRLTHGRFVRVGSAHYQWFVPTLVRTFIGNGPATTERVTAMRTECCTTPSTQRVADVTNGW